MSRLHFAFFAQGADSAGRYGLSFEDLVRHLWQLRRRRGRLVLRSIRYVDDLVHAVGCLGDDSLAWRDLHDRHEPVLVRRCADRVGDMQAILLVRRMFTTLRRNPAAWPGDTETLESYAGDRPLRAWLAERVMSLMRRQHCVWYLPGPHTGRGGELRFSPPGAGLAWTAAEDDEPASLAFPGQQSF